MVSSTNILEQVLQAQPAALEFWKDIWFICSKIVINSELETDNKEVEKCIRILLHVFKAQINDSMCLLKPHDIVSQSNDCLYKEALHLLEQAYSLFKHNT